jgi:EAL domain-containing protein (putative c-di-GMP-specific phosphodiesterase class I)
LDLDRWLLHETISLAQMPSFIAMEAGLTFEISPQSLAHSDVMTSLLDLAALRSAHDSPLVIEPMDLDNIGDLQTEFAGLRAAGYSFKVPHERIQTQARVMKTLPIDYLRLSGDVVAELRHDPRVRLLVAGVVDMAQRLGACTVAEGVPDEGTLEVLRDLNLDYARGVSVARVRSASAVFKTRGGSPRRLAA